MCKNLFLSFFLHQTKRLCERQEGRKGRKEGEEKGRKEGKLIKKGRINGGMGKGRGQM